MASIRRLKKDVDYLTFAVIADCMNYNSRVGKSKPEVVNIVKKMIEYRNGISIDLLKTVDGEFTRLSELVKQNA